MTPAIVGVGAGLLASVAIGRVIESMLFGVSPRDLVTYATVITMILTARLPRASSRRIARARSTLP